MCWKLLHLKLVLGNNFVVEYLDNRTKKRQACSDFVGRGMKAGEAEADCTRSVCIDHW